MKIMNEDQRKKKSDLEETKQLKMEDEEDFYGLDSDELDEFAAGPFSDNSEKNATLDLENPTLYEDRSLVEDERQR
jgi:hypothetical protein